MGKQINWRLNKTTRQKKEYNELQRKYSRIVNEILCHTTRKAKTALYKSGLNYMPTNEEKNRLNRLIYLKKMKEKLEKLLYI